MTIIMTRTHDPVACCVCQRRSTGVGIHERTWVQRGVAWTCDAPECISAAKRLVAMPAKTLDAFEGMALNIAAKSVALPILTAAMTALYDLGVRDLDQATPEQFEAAADALTRDGITSELQVQLAGALESFGSALRDQVAGNAAPF